MDAKRTSLQFQFHFLPSATAHQWGVGASGEIREIYDLCDYFTAPDMVATPLNEFLCKMA